MVIELARKINNLLGREALERLTNGLTTEEMEDFVFLLKIGEVSVHTEKSYGFCLQEGDCYWTDEGFVR